MPEAMPALATGKTAPFHPGLDQQIFLGSMPASALPPIVAPPHDGGHRAVDLLGIYADLRSPHGHIHR
jgi:hypothetical protein